VNDSEVKQIIDTTLNTTPFIETANVLVDQYLGSSSLSDALLRQIEMWWAAHLVAIRDQQAASEGVGKANVTYQGKTGKGLEFTGYGQQVLSLDPTGILATIGKKRAAVFETIQSPTEATPTS
jgi:hypothetical protein